MPSLYRHSALLFALALLALALACAPAPAPAPAPPQGLVLPPQELAPLFKRGDGDGCLLRPAYQAERASDYLVRYFECWTRSAPKHSRAELWALAQPLVDEPGLGVNLRKRPQGWYQALWRAAGGRAYPNTDWKGLTLGPCNLRVLPSREPDFAQGPGGGFPFDRLQQTSLPGGLPVRVWLVSPRGDWLVAETPLALGWLPVRAVGRLSAEQAAQWQQGPFVTVTRDGGPLRTPDGGFLCDAALGWLLPRREGGRAAWRVRFPLAAPGGRAKLGGAFLPRGAAAPFPLSLTPANLEQVAGPLLGRPYDWGGQWGGRDCSALTRDLLAPFGLWLPRNSADQAKAGVEHIPLDGLGNQKKQELIMRRGIPWLSLLYMPGHVMLYVGAPQGQPLVLQALWGLKTRTPQGQGRLVVGRVVLSGLNPGEQLPDLAQPEGLLLPRVTTLALLAPPEELCPRTD
ncbi:NlpC/P60 family N-terminal domain-containing protein [Desulfoferula mesophila]|uniref:Hydrolase Nlp/P60 n=1 Tax=Desulfoferula mesophila TaxID=3058419 RepID=A0AAU9F0Y4_9BACT|nr:hydrolase Nlp/P60 [Desulfoferula mesophilus]